MTETLTELELGLLARAEFDFPYDVCQLKTGRNNQVFRISDRSGRKVVLKRYFHHAKDNRDRLEHELSFLKYAEKTAGSFVPRPLGSCKLSRTALIEWKEGVVFTSTPSENEVLAAAEFIRLLNQEGLSASAEGLPIAADACFTWEEHLRLLQKRIDRLDRIEDSEARRFVIAKLRPLAHEVMAAVERLPKMDRSSLVEYRIVSPSDFGYHNALRVIGEAPCFLDFEYAGWDGFGKMVADFFLQPHIPVGMEYLREFEKIILRDEPCGNRGALEHSWNALFAIHAVKWCCIMLNDFLTVDGARRDFAGVERTRELKVGDALDYFEKMCVPQRKALAVHLNKVH